jgi:hypothetical protein
VGVKHISAGSWDPCNFSTKKPINSLADLQGQRIFTFPTAGRFLTRFGVVPVTVPWEDVQVSLQTGELDGIAWSGITEVYTSGWADVTGNFLTNNISGAWIGHFFANMESWNKVPPHLQQMLKACFDSSHYYRQHWYWNGEALSAHLQGQDEADDHSGCRMGHGADGSREVLGGNRRRERAQGQDRRHHQEVQRDVTAIPQPQRAEQLAVLVHCERRRKPLKATARAGIGRRVGAGAFDQHLVGRSSRRDSTSAASRGDRKAPSRRARRPSRRSGLRSRRAPLRRRPSPSRIG